MKVYEFARELGIETIALMDKVKEWGLPVKSHMASLDEALITEIKNRFSEIKEAAPKGKKKTKTKKKTAQKAGTKKTASKKKVAKKKVTTTVTKANSTTTAAIAETPIEKAPATKRVIRRKASEVKEIEEAELAAQAAAKQVMEAEAQATQSPEATQEVQAKVEGKTPAKQEGAKVDPASSEEAAKEETKAPAKQTRVFGKNIVGKIDLSKIQDSRKKPGNNQSGGDKGKFQSGPRSAQRGLRTGFVAMAPALPIQQNEPGKRKEDRTPPPKKKAGAGGAKEQPVTAFKAADFRKREMVFQPKKKKVAIAPGRKTEITTPAAHKRVVKVNESITLSELAQTLGVKAPRLLKDLMKQGVSVKMNSSIDFDTVSLLVAEYGWEAENVHTSSDDFTETVAFGDLDADPVLRAPVVTVMGHVDHGKTTLLDSIRNANVASGEAGGITQHIGAYRVYVEKDKPITFIDTPGHAAFTAMRARGANITDIVILVVAADDGMMPQTEEAISHSLAAKVPIIVAVNKMDKEGANPDKIKQQLSDKELVPEDWGGQTMFQEVSAIKGDGIKNLLENIWLQAEVLELKANPDRSASGIVIESKVEKGKGIVATLLVQEGTLKTGDAICVGTVSGKVRRLMDDQGKVVKSAGPSVPVEIMGLPESPSAGDSFDVCKTEQLAAELAGMRAIEREKKENEGKDEKLSLEAILAKVKTDGSKELPVILKTDVVGSLEAVKGLVGKIKSDEVKVNFIHSAVGGISESDVLLASTSGGIVVGFNVRPDNQAVRMSKEKGVEIKSYRVIYELLDDIKTAMSGLLDPDIVEKDHGRAEVRETFSIPKIGMIAGSFVVDGKINRNHMVRLVREGRVVYEGKVSSLKRFKDDTKEVASGFECGIGIENYNDIKVGDVIEAFSKEEVAREIST